MDVFLFQRKEKTSAELVVFEHVYVTAFSF